MLKNYEVEITYDGDTSIITASEIKDLITNALENEKSKGLISRFSVCVDSPQCRSIKARDIRDIPGYEMPGAWTKF